MTYTVVWKPSAQDELAELWMAAGDRNAVSSAANAIDIALRKHPYADSKLRGKNKWVRFFPPLGVSYGVSDADCMVTITSVWRTDTNGATA